MEGLVNMIIYRSGDSDAEAEKSHDAALMAFLERCRKEGVKLNPIKFTFKKTSVSYMGHIFNAQGLAPDPDKVKAISEMQRPTDIQGVQQLLGVVNYLDKRQKHTMTVTPSHYLILL